MTDTLVFYSKPDPFEPWADALRPLLPDLDIKRAEDIVQPEHVRFALVWNPPSGFFADFPSLQLVINLGAGVDKLLKRTDLPDIPIVRLQDREMARMMASYALFAVIRHARDIPHFESAKIRHEWSYIHPRPASEVHVAVLGLGHLGGLVATEIARQGYVTHGWATRPKDLPGVNVVTRQNELHKLLAKADIVVSMLPLTPDTYHLLDASAFKSMKQGAAFINLSRGEVVDESALIAALRSGHLSGVTLDVFEQEPLPAQSPLWDLPNVLITPHLASVALPCSAAPEIADAIHAVQAGTPLNNYVRRDLGY
ncbi:MAG: glyoxylate/hydroxypyruvate reductase A [Acetobacter sp.]|uniref:2-hydroxyacid dehydrogenase n=1 Tax=Acetobacter sp. TaxID=440 RepID=UPI0039E9D536